MTDSSGELNFGPYEIDGPSVRLLPQVFCLTHDVLVLGQVDPDADTPVVVGLANPDDIDTLDAISRVMRGRRVLPVKVSEKKIRKALELVYGLDKVKEPLVEESQDPPQEKDGEVMLGAPEAPPPSAGTGVLSVGGKLEVPSPIKTLVNELLLDGLRRGATDIHLESFRYGVVHRIKIDGLLHRVKSNVNQDNLEEVLVRMKVMANLDISERRAPQDGRIVLTVDQNGREQDVAFRVSIIPGPYGEDVVLRVLDKSMAPIDLELLGFTKRDLGAFKTLLANPQGLVLNSGPTGSGKTTTLYASLKHINNPHIKILSAEDPIEYDLDGVCQKQIGPKLDFAELARAFLRHDPDVLLIGEIRDAETADVAAKAAQTGHLVLSTVHTNDAVHAVSRLQSLGLEPEAIAAVLVGVLSQRLVRRVCTRCRESYMPEKSVRQSFGRHIEGLEFVHGRGCGHCNRTGFRGRIGLFELFVVDEDIQLAIQNEVPVFEINKMAVERGMRPLVFDGLLKVERKITNLEELLRVIPLRQITPNLKSD